MDPEGVRNQKTKGVYRLFKEDFQVPKKVLELNPYHPILMQLNSLPPETELGHMIMDQIYENALLIEGLHPDPAGMIDRIQKIIQAAIK